MYTLIKNNKVIGNYTTKEEATRYSDKNSIILHKLDKLDFINRATLKI